MLGKDCNDKHAAVVGKEEWNQLEQDAQLGPVPGFRKKLSLIIETSLSEYDQ